MRKAMSPWVISGSLAILVILLVPVFDSSMPVLENVQSGGTICSIEVSLPGLIIGDDPRDIHIDAASVTSSGYISIGLSDGTPFQEVVDPVPGSPMIPWIATIVETRFDILDIELLKETKRGISFFNDIATIPPAYGHWDEEIPYGRWYHNSVYPDNRVRLEPIGYRHIDGEIYRIYSLWYSPVNLDPENGNTLSTSAEMGITLSDEMTNPSSTRSEGDPALVPGTLSITDRMEVPPEYIIITDTGNMDELQVLADWRNRKGLATSVVDINEITYHYSGSEDPADLMKEYIKDVHSGWGELKYVLLAGDWDTVPAKHVKDSDPSNWDDGWIPADTFFQCLDGTWDLDGDGIFGEPGDLEDIIPDVVVSRLAINDEDTWESKIDQLIRYEMGEDLGDWSDTSVLLGAHTHNEGDGSHYSDYLWDKYLDDSYSTVTKLYEDDQSLSHSTIDQAFTDGNTFMQFVDHGGPNEWCDDYGAGVVYRSRDARALENDVQLPFISALACLTTWFDDTSGCPYGNWENCLGESFTENTEGGAIGYVGSSRVSVGIINTNRYLPYDNGLIEDIARQIGGQRTYVMGDVHTNGKAHYAEVWGGQFSSESNPEVCLCWYEFTLLGEPAVDLWTGGSERISCDVEHEDDLDPHISITVKDENGDPIPDANVSLQNFDRKVFQRATTDGEGKVVFDLVLDWFCDINLTIVKHDMIPFSGFIRISDIIPPVTSMITDPAEPDGENGWFIDPVNISLVPNERGIVHYRIDSGNYITLNGSRNFTISDLPEGEHILHFFGEDEAGNLEMEQHRTIRIDRSDPSLDVNINPEYPDGSNGWYTTEPMITLSMDPDDKGSPVSFEINIDGVVSTYTEPIYIGEGTHTVVIIARDASGRSSNSSTFQLNVDITSPITDIDIFPPEPDGENGWYVTNPRITLTPSESDCTVEYRTSSKDDFIPYEADFQIADGKYQLEYRSIDISGNLEESSKISLMVDTMSPSIDYRLTPQEPDGRNGWYREDPSLMFQWEDNQAAVIMVSMDGSGWEEWKGSMDVGEGVHDIEAYTEDLSGHKSQIISFEIKVDTTYPETDMVLSGVKSGNWFTSVPSISFSSSEESHIYYRFKDDPEPILYSSTISPEITEGADILYYFSEDMAGNIEIERSVTLNIDINEPRPTLDYSIEGDLVLLSADRSTDGTDLMFRYTIDGKVVRDWSTEEDLDIRLEEGIHSVRVDVRDEGGNIASRTIQIEIDGPGYIPYIIVVFMVLIGITLVIGMMLTRRDRTRRYHEEMSQYSPEFDGPDHR